MSRRRWGQHFLADERILECIVEAGGLSRSDLVLEVGVGDGTLTKRLAEKAGWVIGFEIDPLLFAKAQEQLRVYHHVFLYQEDFLKVDFVPLLLSFPAENRKCIANIPYGISTPFFLALLKTAPELFWERFVVMVQHEFGKKLLSFPPKGKGNLLALGITKLFSVEQLLAVPPSAFRPNPKVRSLVLAGRRRGDPPPDFIPFLEFAMTLFRQRRKALQSLVPEIVALAPDLGGKRAEDLTLPEWERLWESARVVLPLRRGYNGIGENHAKEYLGGR